MKRKLCGTDNDDDSKHIVLRAQRIVLSWFSMVQFTCNKVITAQILGMAQIIERFSRIFLWFRNSVFFYVCTLRFGLLLLNLNLYQTRFSALLLKFGIDDVVCCYFLGESSVVTTLCCSVSFYAIRRNSAKREENKKQRYLLHRILRVALFTCEF